jgi:uncharacterized protein (TIGR00251 family)
VIEHSEKDGALTFKVQVVPRAARSEIVGEYNGALRVRVAASPVNGAANEELVISLAKAFGVPKGAVAIVSGHSSKQKRVSVSGATSVSLVQLGCGRK